MGEWLQALTLLFNACEPLSVSNEDYNENIRKCVFYCLHVKKSIEDGVEPLKYKDWDTRERKFSTVAMASTIKITPEEMQKFSNDLTSMFAVKV